MSRTALPVVSPRAPDLFGPETGLRRRVLLVCPPFQVTSLSSLSVAHLATFLRERGVTCEEAYLHFDLSRLIGRKHYSKIAGRTPLIGELLFAEALHGSIADAEIEAKLASAFGDSSARHALIGFPGETLADYDEQIALMQHIPQLPPPNKANPIHIDRFSPYFKNYAAFGCSRIEPVPEYRSLHPALSEAELSDVAYHFRGVGGVTTDTYFDRFSAEIQNWRRRHIAGEGLFLHPKYELIRNSAAGMQRLYGPGLDRVLECTHEPTPLHRVLEHSRCDPKDLARLTEDRVLFMEAGKVLNLAIRLEPPVGDSPMAD